METLLPLVLDGLSGRTWEGKEQVVELLPALSISSKTYLSAHQAKLSEIAKVNMMFFSPSCVARSSKNIELTQMLHPSDLLT